MSFYPISPAVHAEMHRPTAPGDIDLVLQTCGMIAGTVPEILPNWESCPEMKEAVGKPPMMQRFLIMRAMSNVLNLLDQTYKVNTMAERAALNDSQVPDATYLQVVFSLCLKKLRTTFDKPAPEPVDTDALKPQEAV